MRLRLGFVIFIFSFVDGFDGLFKLFLVPLICLIVVRVVIVEFPHFIHLSFVIAYCYLVLEKNVLLSLVDLGDVELFSFVLTLGLLLKLLKLLVAIL